MANRTAHIERDRHGRERVVLTNHRRSSSRTRQSSRELLDEAEKREQHLIARNQDLQAQLNWAQVNECNTRNEYHRLFARHQDLVNDHCQCRDLRAQLQIQTGENRRLEGLIEAEKHEKEALEEKVRLLKRTSLEGYRQRYEEKARELEILKRQMQEAEELKRLDTLKLVEKSQTILELKERRRLDAIRLEGKTQLISDLKEHLRRLGYRFD
ncbi:hypothetical protein M430DRAFT_221113 [Amorphotheca resinae ATCC 22711]|jgi:hypothetical protein|uniref:Uncharacterized protein n=1 Tax=Amorphotheca resinae ATCC 22711 TaxID=857342 RepID=A0A2T3B5R1_AMORE|nr:hypothetical protein M430DRAFT_221113 [Amorphotheca resinae ATCC 22711]PSS22099.1 hypothetical protein M430DRAFT_221113 [Amorphotheca resinae ATCC 22711]